ncbi:MAG: glycoside hydrolase family 19 protein [Sandaracinus sp.]
MTSRSIWVVAFLVGCAPAAAPASDAALADAAVGHDVGASADGGIAADAAAAIDGGAPDDAATVHDDAGATGLGDLLDRATFDALFPHRGEAACNASLYDYDALVAAAAHYPAFASEGSLEDRRRELAGFLANASHETTGGWPTAPDGPHAWGLCFREEVGCESGACTGYCDATAYPCIAGQTYHGRGPLQLSWNYNYAQCGDAIGQDLLHDPGLVTRDGAIGWETALWFWMTPQAPKPSCHDAITGQWTPSAADLAAGRRPGFGVTVDIINGGLECHIPGDARVADRVGFYMRYCDLLGVTTGSDVDCASMSPF